MLKMNLFLFSIYICVWVTSSCSAYVVDIDAVPDIFWFEKKYSPTQIHLSFGNTVSDIVVTWVTMSKTATRVCYGTGELKNCVDGKEETFADPGGLNRVYHVHRVFLSNLNENTKYYYKCGSDKAWSDEYNFHTLSKNSSYPFHFAIYGDLGIDNGVSIPALKDEVGRNMYDAIFHIGDIAYNLDFENGTIGDRFMEAIQPIAAFVPYMTGPGNHEAAHDFLHYRKRFSMPGGTEGMHYSINIGPIHFVMYSSEVYYFVLTLHDAKVQYEWLENDLREAASPKNRTERPWIIVMSHRAMYCSTDDGDDCRNVNNPVRVGRDEDSVGKNPMENLQGKYSVGKYPIEKLLRKYSVDIGMFGHEHTYERTWPLYNYTVYNGTSQNPYHNPLAMIHIISGAAGCPEKVDKFVEKPGNWSAFRTNDYSYTRLHVFNKTHLYFEQVSADKNFTVDDHYWISKDLGWVYPTD